VAERFVHFREFQVLILLCLDYGLVIMLHYFQAFHFFRMRFRLHLHHLLPIKISLLFPPQVRFQPQNPNFLLLNYLPQLRNLLFEVEILLLFDRFPTFFGLKQI